jgi:hypothetical protein
MTTNLYDIAADLQAIHNAIIEMDGEIVPDLEASLDRLNLELSNKVHGIGKWMRNLEGNETALQTEIDRLEKRKKSITNLESRLKEYVRLCMEKSGKRKLEFPLFTAAIQANPPSVEITDEQKLPAKYVKVEQVTKIDKQGVLDGLKAGEEIEGARLVTDKNHLRIR